MLNLAEYRNKPQSLADFLPWAALIAPGVILNKDGSFQRTARFRGPDLDSATPAELVGTTVSGAGGASARDRPALASTAASGLRKRVLMGPSFGLRRAGRSARRKR